MDEITKFYDALAEADDPKIKIEKINTALKALPSDDDRIAALDGICRRCGRIDDKCYCDPAYDE